MEGNFGQFRILLSAVLVVASCEICRIQRVSESPSFQLVGSSPPLASQDLVETQPKLWKLFQLVTNVFEGRNLKPRLDWRLAGHTQGLEVGGWRGRVGAMTDADAHAHLSSKDDSWRESLGNYPTKKGTLN